MKLMIYGAKSFALSAYRALQELYPSYPVEGFLVTSLEGNSPFLAGLPVTEIEVFSRKLTQEEKQDICILVGTPEDVHPDIVHTIKKYGYKNYICLESRKEAKLMEAYYTKKGIFPSLHQLPDGDQSPALQVFAIQFYRDYSLESRYQFPDWVCPIQAGADLTDIRVSACTDNTGDNISGKNGNYCEMTAFYWLWKNRLMKADDAMEYYGFYHYRRFLDISEEDIRKLKKNDIDVVLQFPTIHEPDMGEHHERYVKEADWQAMLQAMEELQPAYARAYHDIFSQEYFYNYNLIIAKKAILADYCAWLFPILERTEELSTPKGWERADRYTAYMSESLMTFYFLYNQKRLKIYHTGRFMLT